MIVTVFTRDRTERLGNRLWVLTAPFSFSVDRVIYTIPPGFVTDGASCPRIFWSICSPVAGPFGQAAIAHDWFYNEGPSIGRFRADKILYAMARYRGAGWARAKVIQAGVNMFGWGSYKKGSDKMTDESCYDLKKARLRVGELKK